jgi:G3E family GTPase
MAQARTPLTLITGPLGSGKTTLLRHILASVPERLAVLMNEFGEIAIDSKVVAGKNIRIAELGGGCVCCSLLGEFEAAVNEILDAIDPDRIVVETTGVAEPDALIFNIEESLPRVRLDGVIAIADADAFLRFPRLGHTTRLQLESADTLLLNKADLVAPADLETIERELRSVNETADILRTERCRGDPDLLFGIAREKAVQPPAHIHQPEFDSFTYRTHALLNRTRFEDLANDLHGIYRAKGFVRFAEGSYLFNFVAGRWELESFPHEDTILVFIGRGIQDRKSELAERSKGCEEETRAL